MYGSSVVGQGSTFTAQIPKGRAHLPPDRIGISRGLASTFLATDHYVEEALRWLPDGIVPENGEPIAPRAIRRDAASGSSRPRVLWADDNADMRGYVSRLLSPMYEVEAVSDGDAALAAVRRQLIDLILADDMMPRLDGSVLQQAAFSQAPDSRQVVN